GTSLAAEPSRSAVMKALAAARVGKTFSVLDIDYRAYSWASAQQAASIYAKAARCCDAVIGNEDEFSLIAGDGCEVSATAERLIKNGCAFVILKKGVHDSVTFTPKITFETGTFPVRVLKPFGAGDAFAGALFAALLRGDSIQAAVIWGTAAAALVVARRGCASAMPTAAEVETLISQQPSSTGRKNAHPTL